MLNTKTTIPLYLFPLMAWQGNYFTYATDSNKQYFRRWNQTKLIFVLLCQGVLDIVKRNLSLIQKEPSYRWVDIFSSNRDQVRILQLVCSFAYHLRYTQQKGSRCILLITKLSRFLIADLYVTLQHILIRD